jgi:hypothetical protein
MEIFMLFLYALSVFVLYQSVQADDTDYDKGEDSGEFNLIDAL